MRTIRYQKNNNSMRCAHVQLSLTFTMCFVKKRCRFYGGLGTLTQSDNSALESARQFVEAVDKEDIELKSE